MMEDRIHIDEFLSSKGLTNMVQAGFRAYVNKAWMFVDEWEGKLQEYLNR